MNKEPSMVEKADALSEPYEVVPYGSDRDLLCRCWPERRAGVCGTCKPRLR